MSDEHSAFHEGEMAIQRRLGVAEQMDPVGKTNIRPFMPDQHRQFFASLGFIVLGVLDRDGRPWVTAAFGAPGFVSSADARTMSISAPIMLADRLNLDLRPKSKLGVIGIEPPTGRRNRVNGIIQTSDEDVLQFAVDQSYGNCSQHIHRRALNWHPAAEPMAGSSGIESADHVSPDAHALIAHVDTFFIASRSQRISSNPTTGVDVSHRGGKSGFVKICDNGRLRFPDLSGNNFFNTLGNIHDDGRVGLLFPEVGTSSAVLVTGDAAINWNGERSVDVTPREVVSVNGPVTRDAGSH